MITFKKYLKTKKAQATMEYFIIFALFALLCLFAINSKFFKDVHSATETMFESGKDKIVNASSQDPDDFESSVAYWY